MKHAQDYLGTKPIPNGLDLVQQGISMGNEITMGVSAFCKHHGVSSELEYKLKMAYLLNFELVQLRKPGQC